MTGAPTAAARPAYVDRGGELVYRQPYEALHTRQDVFFLRADRERLDRMFDRYFTAPSGGAVPVRPLTELIALSVVHIDAIGSAEPPHDTVGAGIAEWEVAVWTVGVDTRRGRPVFFTPYLFVDSGMAMAAGREVYGLPKQDGRFAVAGGDPLDRLTLEVLGSERFSPTTMFTWQPLLQVERVGAEPSRAMPWRTLGDAAAGMAAALGDRARTTADAAASVRDLGDVLDRFGEAVEGLVDGAALWLRIAAAVGSGQLPVLALKQFRDVAAPGRACYQAITESPSRVTRLRGGGLLGDYRLTLRDLESAPIVRELGLPGGLLTPVAAGWILYDFRFEAGRELWKA